LVLDFASRFDSLDELELFSSLELDGLEECIVELEEFFSELVEELEACMWYNEVLLEAPFLLDPNARLTTVAAPE
jgi:hypothetical protein